MSLRSFFSGSNNNKPPVYYKRANTPTRFDECAKLNCPEIKDIVQLVEQIRAKVTVLDKDPNSKRAETVDYAKYTIMSTLLAHLDAPITEFNAGNQHPVMNDELNAVSAVVLELSRILKHVLADESQHTVLQTPRNSNKQLAQTGTQAGLIGTAAIISLPLTFFWGAVYCAMGVGLSEAVKHYAGLKVLDPDSIIMTNQLDKVLDDVNLKIEVAIKLASGANRPSH